MPRITMAYTVFLVAPAAVLLICAVTYLWTTLRYRLALRNTNNIQDPPHLPYTIPWLGSARDWLAPTPGSFYTQLLSWHPREVGACTVLLGGETLHLLNAPAAVHAMFKLKNHVANRDGMNETIMRHAAGMSPVDYEKYDSVVHKDHQLSTEYLLRQSHANDLAREFTRCYGDALRSEVQAIQGETGSRKAVDLYAWLQSVQFGASTTAYMGEHIKKIYPGFAKDFFTYDRGFLDLIYGFSKLLKPKAYAARDKVLDGCTKWIEAMDQETGGKLVDANDPETAWEPQWGSRISRARQALWKSVELSPRGRASLELGFLFGLNSNAIPITGWMLMHILDPRKPGLLARVLVQIEQCAAMNAAGAITLNIQKLASDPLMQSIFHETLRLYTDVLVTRELFEDVKLPLTESKDSPSWLQLKKGTRVLAPTLMNHWDSTHFVDPPADVFCAERYLVPSNPEKEKSGDYSFSSEADRGKHWPWGGGKTMCPGRLFAKQEVLAAVALVLLSFDVKPVDERAYKIPGFAPSPPGSGGLVPGGDVRVWLRPKLPVKT